jgi:hypothetical protein
LVVIFLTDEEDCSRNADVAPFAEVCDSPNGCDLFSCNAPGCVLGRSEYRGEVCGFFNSGRETSAGECYGKEGELTPVSCYASRLRAYKPAGNIDIAVIAGGLPDASGAIVEGSCKVVKDPVTNESSASGACIEKQGLSNTCSPDDNCCLADGGGRYFELAEQLGGLKNTICVDDFNQTMVNIAVKVGDVATLSLAEEPADLTLIIVEKASAGSSDYVVVPRLTNITECPEGADGWFLDGDHVTIRFCGNARPLGGERVRVGAKGDSADPAGGPAACVDRDANPDGTE